MFMDSSFGIRLHFRPVEKPAAAAPSGRRLYRIDDFIRRHAA